LRVRSLTPKGARVGGGLHRRVQELLDAPFDDQHVR
jgi:hypothetical protein